MLSRSLAFLYFRKSTLIDYSLNNPHAFLNLSGIRPPAGPLRCLAITTSYSSYPAASIVDLSG